MKTKEQLLNEIKKAAEVLSELHNELKDLNALPENNVFESLEEAGRLAEVLHARAFEDCEGAYNCGVSEYTQLFMVRGEVYEATFTPQYNRHDKMYYYIEESEFSINLVKD